MNKLNEYFQRVEHELRDKGVVNEIICHEFANLPLDTRTAYVEAMRFIGCSSIAELQGKIFAIPEADRIHGSRLMLLSFYPHKGSFAWSSWLLDGLLKAVMSVPGGCIGDLLHALYDVLGEFVSDLTETVATFIKDLVVKCFSEYRSSYQSTDLGWMVEKIVNGCIPTQAYLALLAIPPSPMSPECSVAILRSLESTQYWEQALNMLSEELVTEKSRSLLQAWRVEGMSSQSAVDIEHALQRPV